MRSTPGDVDGPRAVAPTGDATRERIRDAALERFARDGLDAPLRVIAADAGVSAPLILHHFGSRAGLRTACDAYVTSLVEQSKSAVLDPLGGADAFRRLAADTASYAVVLGYLLRLLQAGGETTRGIVDRLADNACAYLTNGVAAGTIRESRDLPALARWLTEMSLGALLLELPTKRGTLEIDELADWLTAYQERILGPALELFTHGLLTHSTLLDTYLGTRNAAPSPPSDHASSGPQGATHD